MRSHAAFPCLGHAVVAVALLVVPAAAHALPIGLAPAITATADIGGGCFGCSADSASSILTFDDGQSQSSAVGGPVNAFSTGGVGVLAGDGNPGGGANGSARAAGNLSSGLLRARASAHASSGAATSASSSQSFGRVHVLDFFTLSQASTVTIQGAVDGTVNFADCPASSCGSIGPITSDGSASFDFSVRVFDPNLIVGEGEFFEFGRFDASDVNESVGGLPHIIAEHFLLSLALPGNTDIGFELDLQTFADARCTDGCATGASADFENTATFGFALPSGVILISASGALPVVTSVAVPEPPMLLLLTLAGALGFAALRTPRARQRR